MKRFGLVFDDPNDGEIILYYNAEDKISAIQKEAADGEKDIEQIDKSSVNNAIFPIMYCLRTKLNLVIMQDWLGCTKVIMQIANKLYHIFHCYQCKLCYTYIVGNAN